MVSARDERTPEQVAADEGLRDALVRVRAAYADSGDEQAAVLVDHVAVSAFSNADGETVYYLALTDGAIPHYRAVGLLEMGRTLLDAQEVD